MHLSLLDKYFITRFLNPFLAKFFYFIPSEDIRKPKAFWFFMGNIMVTLASNGLTTHIIRMWVYLLILYYAFFNPFPANVSILYPLKISEN